MPRHNPPPPPSARQLLGGQRHCPWRRARPVARPGAHSGGGAAAAAAGVVGAHSFGCRTLRPRPPPRPTPPPHPQIEGILRATTLGAGDASLDDALFAHAESVTNRFFGPEVYYRGIVEFSNVRRALGGRGCTGDWWCGGVLPHTPPHAPTPTPPTHPHTTARAGVPERLRILRNPQAPAPHPALHHAQGGGARGWVGGWVGGRA